MYAITYYILKPQYVIATPTLISIRYNRGPTRATKMMNNNANFMVLNGKKVPMPMTVAPPNGMTYFAVLHPGNGRPVQVVDFEWESGKGDINERISYYLLSLNCCHLTRSAAEKHMDALLLGKENESVF